MMSGFRRNYSKVWWASYFQERDRTEKERQRSPRSSLSPSLLQFNRSRRRSTDESNSDRNSSSSPSNGSHKSQDSGFSDSESSTPSSCSAKVTGNDKYSPSESLPEISVVRGSSSMLPETPTNSVEPKTNESTSSDKLQKFERGRTNNRVSAYLSECYFSLATLIDGDESPQFSQPSHTLSNSLPASRDIDQVEDRRSPYETQSKNGNGGIRTCFIVGETPKKNPARSDSLLSSYADTNESSTEGSYSLSYDDTVKFVESSPQCQLSERNIQSTPARALNLPMNATYEKSDSNESRVSSPDLNLLPEPTFTSTPKKDLQIIRKINKKLRDSPLVTGSEQKLKPKLESEPIENNETDAKFVDPPVARWLWELQYHYEVECMTTLQAKRIPRYYEKKASDILMVSESTNSFQMFHQQTKIISSEFLNLYESMNLQMREFFNSQLGILITTIKDFIINYSQLLPRMDSIEKENVLKIMDMCDRFQNLFVPVNQQTLLDELKLLEKFYSRFVDSVLMQQIMLLMLELETPNSETTLLTALNGITALNLHTPRIRDLVTRLDGVQKLLTISLQSSSSVVRKTALRSLTIICQYAPSIRQLERIRGVEMISKMLCDEGRDEVELTEVVSVLVQITAPWIEDDHIIKGLIYHLYAIINALTRLIIATSSGETLLLCTAALANISFIEPQAVFVVVKLNTLGGLLTAVRKLGVRASIFLQEQVATLIANMAAEPDTRPHLAQHRAVGALLCFLQVKHFPLQTNAEIAAAERLQHKSAVALSRLCSSAEIAKQVVELQGVSRLVRLCREERERNYSDGVLVACLTSLRKITATCGSESIMDLDAKELVEPRLVDTFLMYSSKQESYV